MTRLVRALSLVGCVWALLALWLGLAGHGAAALWTALASAGCALASTILWTAHKRRQKAREARI